MHAVLNANWYSYGNTGRHVTEDSNSSAVTLFHSFICLFSDDNPSLHDAPHQKLSHSYRLAGIMHE